MFYLAIGAVALLVFVLWRYRATAFVVRGEWRPAAGLLSIGMVMAGAFAAVRGSLPLGLGLVAVGGVLMAGARTQRVGSTRSAPTDPALSLDDARALLGVRSEATPAEIRAAYTKLIRMVHPDQGGTSGLAAQLNAARDRLLKS